MRRVLLASCAAVLACTPARNDQQFRLRIALVGPLTPLVPHGEPSASGYALAWVFETLLRSAPDGSPTPNLAGEFRFLTPARMVMRIRDGARFSDGSPVTTEDVRLSLRDAGIDVREQGNELLVESSSGAPVEPLLRIEPIFKSNGEQHFGTGPFQVVSMDPERILLRRRTRIAGRIGEVVLLGFPTARDPLARTLAGDADLLIVTDPKQLEFFQGIRRLRVVRGHGANAIAVAMGTARLNQSERRAIAAALPVASISQLVFGEECPPFEPIRTDAKQLPSARPLEVGVIAEDTQLEHVALAIARALGPRSKGIRVVSVADVFELLKGNDFDLMMVRPMVWPPSSVALVWASDSHLNEFGYRNRKVDAAIKAGDWARALHELRDDPPVAFVCTPERLAVVDSRIKNAQVDGQDYLETLPDWEVAE